MKGPFLFFVLHPNNFRKEEAIALECNGLGYCGVKIIREMHRKIKLVLNFRLMNQSQYQNKEDKLQSI